MPRPRPGEWGAGLSPAPAVSALTGGSLSLCSSLKRLPCIFVTQGARLPGHRAAARPPAPAAAGCRRLARRRRRHCCSHALAPAAQAAAAGQRPAPRARLPSSPGAPDAAAASHGRDAPAQLAPRRPAGWPTCHRCEAAGAPAALADAQQPPGGAAGADSPRCCAVASRRGGPRHGAAVGRAAGSCGSVGRPRLARAPAAAH